MRILFYFILLLLFISCDSISTSSSESKIENFSELTFEKQLSYLFENKSLIEEPILLDGLNDSISNYKNHEIYLGQNVDSSGFSFYIDILDISESDPACIKRRNIFDFSIFNDTITARQEIVQNENILLDSLIAYIGNTNLNGFYYPEFRMTKISLLGEKLVSKQIYITYINLLDTANSKSEWENLIKVIDYIRKSYNVIRERSSRDIWQKNFDDLNLLQKKSILKLHPFRMILRFDGIWKTPPPPPPPPVLGSVLEVINQ